MAFTPIITYLIFLFFSHGQRDVGVLENIHGMPYPEQENHILVTEELAHADIYLREPALAKELILDITYRPINVKSLAVGAREDSFWLSYNSRQKIPDSRFQIQNSTVIVPLTDKLADKDGSIDLMFFAESDGDPLWELHRLKASIRTVKPTYAQLKNYFRSLVTREKVL